MTVELERAMLWHLTQSESNLMRFRSALGDHVSTVLEDSTSRRIWSLLSTHFDSTRALMGPEAVRIATEVSLTRPEMEFDFLFTDFRDRVRYRQAWETHRAMTAALEMQDLEAMSRLHERMAGNLRIGASGSSPIMGFRHDVIGLLDRVRSGEMGIEFYWPRMTRATLGMWPGTYTVLAARPGTGKTFFGIVSAWHAERQGHRVLFVSPEMSKVETAERYYVIDASVSYKRMVDGSMGEFEYQRLLEYTQQTPDRNINILDANDDLSLDGILSEIVTYRPDLVVIDAMYAIKAPGKDRSEILRNVSDWCRITAKSQNIAIMCLHQMNQEEKVALADQLFWDAYNMFTMSKVDLTPEQLSNGETDSKKIRITNKKIRRGLATWRDITLHWDWEAMEFGEVGQEDMSIPANLGAVPNPPPPPRGAIPVASPVPVTAQPMVSSGGETTAGGRQFNPDIGF